MDAPMSSIYCYILETLPSSCALKSNKTAFVTTMHILDIKAQRSSWPAHHFNIINIKCFCIVKAQPLKTETVHAYTPLTDLHWI